MPSVITICLSFLLLIFFVQAAPYRRPNYSFYRYRRPVVYYRNNHHHHYYQGYRSPYQYQRQYQGYRSPYQGYQQQAHQRQYQGYGNNYQAYYQSAYARPTPSPFPGLTSDGHGNYYSGTKENPFYIFCASRGCVGRG